MNCSPIWNSKLKKNILGLGIDFFTQSYILFCVESINVKIYGLFYLKYVSNKNKKFKEVYRDFISFSYV